MAQERPTERRSDALFAWLASWQSNRPWTVLAIAVITVAIAAWGASRLTLKTSFGELLPENAESVKVAERVGERLVSASTLTVVAQGDDPDALKKFVDALAPAIRDLGPEWVGNVDDGVRATNQFFRDNALLYAPVEDVREIHEEIVSRYRYEVEKRAGLLIDEDEEPPPAITADSIRKRIDERTNQRAKEAGLPKQVAAEGYYIEPDGRFIAVIIQTPVSIGDIDRGRALMQRIEEVIAEVGPTQFHASITVDYTGDFITGAEQYDQIKSDLANVGLIGLLMIIGIVFLYYLRIRTLIAMLFTVGIGVVWTFGLAWLLIGHLNSSTGFLVSIVAGNGINFGIIYMARYLEARRESDVADSVRIAHAETWASTVAASAAAMTAYGSLIVTDFRGFKHFGVIGGSGMILCWVATYAFLPAMLAASERIWPLDTKSVGFATRMRGFYGRPFAWLIDSFPRALVVGGILLGIGGTAITWSYVAGDPMEYDLSNTRNEPQKTESKARTLGRRVDKIVGRRGQDGLAILVDRLDQVKPLKTALEAKRDAAPEAKKPFSRVVTIFSLLPSDQEEKLALSKEARDKLERAHRKKFVSDEDWEDIEKYLPAEDLESITIADLPEQVVRSFTEKDGTRGRLVFIVPTPGLSVWDAEYLLDFAASFRRTVLPDGSVIQGSGKSVIFADMFLAVISDAPKAIVVSLLGTLLIVLLAFRGGSAAWGAMLTLVLGVIWMIAAMALINSKLTPPFELVGMKLNFLNFVALPISIGISADYVVNILKRYRIAGPGEIRRVISETGGAVVLCSLTTTLGYLALTLSVNLAIQSFGVAGAIGEVSCVLAAVLVMPAWISWRDKRRASLA